MTLETILKELFKHFPSAHIKSNAVVITDDIREAQIFLHNNEWQINSIEDGEVLGINFAETGERAIKAAMKWLMED